MLARVVVIGRPEASNAHRATYESRPRPSTPALRPPPAESVVRPRRAAGTRGPARCFSPPRRGRRSLRAHIVPAAYRGWSGASRAVAPGVAGRLGAERGEPKERSDEVDEAVPGAGGARTATEAPPPPAPRPDANRKNRERHPPGSPRRSGTRPHLARLRLRPGAGGIGGHFRPLHHARLGRSHLHGDIDLRIHPRVERRRGGRAL